MAPIPGANGRRWRYKHKGRLWVELAAVPRELSIGRRRFLIRAENETRMLPIHTIRLNKIQEVEDREVVWAMHVHRDREQLSWCLDRVRSSYPTARVVVINDGDEEDFSDIAQHHGCSYRPGLHLHELATSHLYVRRILEALADGTETYCFKIDPDTFVRRRFSSLPAHSSAFGTLETITEARLAEIVGAPNIQGGCIGLTRDAVVGILESECLSYTECVVRWRDTWARCDDMVMKATGGQFCDDFIISWAANAIGIPIMSWPEIQSRWRRVIANEWSAVSHPHKRPWQRRIV